MKKIGLNHWVYKGHNIWINSCGYYTCIHPGHYGYLKADSQQGIIQLLRRELTILAINQSLIK